MINRENKNVKRKVKPIFNSEFFEDGPSLEDIVEQGEGERDRTPEGKICHINIPACPELVKSSLLYLRRKHERIKNLSSVCRYVIKRGFMDIESIECLGIIEKAMKTSYVEGNELDRLNFTGQSYSFNNRLGFTKHSLSCYLFEWTHAGIIDTAQTLGLKATTVTTLALAFGLARSCRWIPEPHRQKMQQEAEKFQEWVESRVKNL